jgi:hypothetical protein
MTANQSYVKELLCINLFNNSLVVYMVFIVLLQMTTLNSVRMSKEMVPSHSAFTKIELKYR